MLTHASSSAAQHSTAGRAVQVLHDCEEIWLRAAQIVVEHVSSVDRIGRIDRIDVGRVSRENRT